MFIKRSSVACYSMSLVYVFGELLEFMEELIAGDMGGMVKEAGDVIACLNVYLCDRFFGGRGWVVNNSRVKGWAHRWAWWREWLEGQNLPFKPEFMRFGANYKRPDKRDLVRRLAMESKR